MIENCSIRTTSVGECLALRQPFDALNVRSSSSQPTSILVVTADPFLPAALCWALLRRAPITALAVASDIAGAVKELEKRRWAVVLLDADTLDCDVTGAIELLEADCEGHLAILSSGTARDDGIGSGRRGPEYIDRSASLEEIAASLHRADFRTARTARVVAQPEPCRTTAADKLTRAQGKVLALIEQGQLNKQIAYELGIAESTVKAHVSAIFRKLKVQNRVQATLAAHRQASRGHAFGAQIFA